MLTKLLGNFSLTVGALQCSFCSGFNVPVAFLYKQHSTKQEWQLFCLCSVWTV